jgi:oligopeptide transport system substrate-binding protein
VDRSLLPGITRGGELPTAQYTPGRPIRDLSREELALCGVARGAPGVALIVEPGRHCYVPPPGLDFDPARARAELAQARREMGAAFPSRFTIKYNAGSESHKLIAEWLQSEWQRTLGLEADIESQEFKTFLKDVAAGAYDVARSGWIGNLPDPEAEFLNIFRCRSPDNRPKFCAPAYDALLDRAGATADRRQRLALSREAERLLLEEAAIIPLYVYTQKHLRKPYVRDLAITATAAAPFRRVWIDPDWRARPEGHRP